jgi:hypothetical protein
LCEKSYVFFRYEWCEVFPSVKTYHCDVCDSLIFFENTQCLSCRSALAYLPSHSTMVSLGKDGELWKRLGIKAPQQQQFKLCLNYAEHGVCNWALPGNDPESLCSSCRLTQVIPNLDDAGRDAWAKLEAAKRRLVYGLQYLKLPLQCRSQDTQNGLEFRFLSDSVDADGDQSRVFTGHDNGLITINVAEADDVYREMQRQRHREPYRTLLGHFRHEIGHYYWDRLIEGSAFLEQFRALFGDERLDYQESLDLHYEAGAPADWPDSYVSAYASTHPWEDWAESCAHVMHMVDALETSRWMGLSVSPHRADEPSLSAPVDPVQPRFRDFDALITEWVALMYVLNNLSRGLGLPDAYPFVLSNTVMQKLRFICTTMDGAALR